MKVTGRIFDIIEPLGITIYKRLMRRTKKWII
jgi:hypothetical protein